MKALTIRLKRNLTLLLYITSCLSLFTIISNPAIAKSDKQAMGEVQKARAMTQQHKNHTKYQGLLDEKQKFRGVYYGYLPCEDCDGIKSTLSLKNKNNYLLVTQYAKTSTREFYEKGKYTWDDKTSTVTLVSRKDAKTRKYQIKDDETLIYLTPEGKSMGKDQDKYTLRRGDSVKTREVHIH